MQPHNDSAEATAGHAKVEATHLKGHLGTGGLVLTALALNAPLAMMAGYIPFDIGLGLGAATPLVFVLVMALMLVFAVGVLAMARHMRQPGAFYTYITAGLGRSAGLGAGLCALVGYILLAGGSYVFTGILIQKLVAAYVPGIHLDWWVGALGMWVLVTAISLFNIDVSTKVLGVFLCVEVAIVLLWNLRVFLDGGPEGRGLDVTAQLGTGSAGMAFLFGVASLAGFESLQVFRTETHDPLRTIPRASYATVALLAAFYALSSWAYLVAFGTDAAIATAADPAGGFTESLAHYAGRTIADLAVVIMVTSALASLLAMQNISARYVFALGRDGVLPAWLGKVDARFHAPTRAAGAIGASLGVFTLAVLALRLDPVLTYLATSGLGLWTLITLMGGTALSVVRSFRRNTGLEPSVWKALIAPGLATLGFAYVITQATLNKNVMMGGNATLATVSIGLVVAVFVGALVYSRWLHARRHEVWLRIGNQD
ncbi:APC family permease [Streptomyces sp. NPDC050145]|uniref:APC family permease n=1 Tax=Streptomyces sp. NPDC050145 TaxID=3365602 RepID=UPI00378C9833